MENFLNNFGKHILWALVAIVLACLALIGFGDHEAAKAAQNVLGGIAFVVVVAMLLVWFD